MTLNEASVHMDCITCSDWSCMDATFAHMDCVLLSLTNDH